jgi:hypothetical protein
MTITHADLANIHAWIRYLDAQRGHAMSNIETISARMDAMGSAVDRVAIEMADLKAKLDAATAEDPRLAAIADHAAAILDKLNAVSPAPVVEPVAEAAAEPVADQPAQ